MPALRPLLTLPRRLRPSFTRHFSPIPDTAFLNADNTVLRTFLPPADIAPFPTFSRRLLCPLLSSTPLSQPAPAPTRRLSRVPAPADAASLNSVMPPLPAPTASHITPPVTAFFHSALFPPYPTRLPLMPTTLFYELFFLLPTPPPLSAAVFSTPCSVQLPRRSQRPHQPAVFSASLPRPTRLPLTP